MKKIMLAVVLILAASTFTFAQMNPDTSTTQKKMGQKKYTCSMHKTLVRSRPGKCPKCGMKLVAKKTKEARMDKRTADVTM